MLDPTKIIIKDISNESRGDFVVNGQTFHFVHANTQKGDDGGTGKFIVNHWTASLVNYLYDDYHFNTGMVNNIPFVFKTLGKTTKGQHLWGRNTNALGVSMCCMSKGDKPSADLVEMTAILNGELCCWRNINPHENITLDKKTSNNDDRIWNVGGTISVPTVTDHGTFGKLDNYDRWDIGDFLPVVQKRCKEVYDQLKAGKRKFIFKDIL